MAVPTINRLIDAGIEARGLFGQWDHDYPDRPVQLDDRSELGGGVGEAFPEMIRFDWMQDMLEWFDYYLKGIGEHLDNGLKSNPIKGHGALKTVIHQRMSWFNPLNWAPIWPILVGPRRSYPMHLLGPFGNLLLLKAISTLRACLVSMWTTTATLGGQLYALLEDCNDQGQCIHLGHAIMDLRYHAGGDEVQTWTPVVETINAKMEFFAMDAEVEAGHVLRLSFALNGRRLPPPPVLPPSCSCRKEQHQPSRSTHFGAK